jgi:sugar phosphate isomerase/epimerase
MVSRRQFVSTMALTSLAFSRATDAVEPLKRNGSPRLLLGLAAYSFRQFFKGELQKRSDPEPKDKGLDMLSFIDYCADQGIAGAELTSYFLPKDLSGEQLQSIRRHAFLRGVAISGTAVGNNFALPKGEAHNKEIAAVKAWIDRAALLGAPHIRVFAGSAPKGFDPAEAKKVCIEALEECCEHAGKKGIFLGLENHGGIVAEAEALLEIVQAVKSPWLGINLDSGNFHTDDPYGDLAKCAPYTVNAQVKVELKKRGAKESEAMDYAKIVKLLRDANYQGFVTLEYEAKEDPWTAVPRELKRLREALA